MGIADDDGAGAGGADAVERAVGGAGAGGVGGGGDVCAVWGGLGEGVFLGRAPRLTISHISSA